ncbi:hypothetical protein GCM10028857_04450 [Salinarchaeum chitinilyticum]
MNEERPIVVGLAVLGIVLAMGGLLLVGTVPGVAGAGEEIGGPAASDSTIHPSAESSVGTSTSASAVAEQQLAAQQADGQGTVTREGGDVRLAIPADRLAEAGETVNLSVAVPDVDGSATVTATREGDHYVAIVPIPAVVPANATSDLAAATLTASDGESVVLDGVVDLRYVAQTGPATFDDATLSIPADVRGLGGAAPTLVATASDDRFDATVEGAGPDASLRVAPGQFAGIPADRIVNASVEVGAATVSPAPVEFSIADAAGRATALAYDGTDLVVHQPLVHPDLGPATVDVIVTTESPSATFSVRDSGPEPYVTIPSSVVGAGEIRVRVTGVGDGVGSGGAGLLDVSVAAPSRATVPLRIANGTLYAPEPSALAGYDMLLLRDGTITAVPIGPGLHEGTPRQLPAGIARPSQDATAILLGDGRRPARVGLSVAPPPPAPDPDPEPIEGDSEGDAFVALWLDVGSVVSLLFLAMGGSVLAVGAVYGVRLLSPARSAAAGPRAILAHFVFGGIGGVALIALVQSLFWGPVLGSVAVASSELGMGALLVGTFHGGLTATGIRLGLGTVDAWPTRRVIDETAVPVRIRFTDDEGDAIDGEQTVEIRRTSDGSLVETTALAGTTTEVELSPGEYEIQGQTADRATDAVELSIDEPNTPRPETIPLHLTVSRPGLQVEVTDAQTEAAIPSGQVTVTTDREETKSATIEDGSVTTSLPVATGAVTAVVSAPGYDDATVEVPIETELTTADVTLQPSSGTLVASAIVAGDPIADAKIEIEPADEMDGALDGQVGGADANAPDPANAEERSDDNADPEVADSTIGVRTADGTTDENGTVRFDLPTGRYRASLVLDGPNADLFAVSDDVVAVDADAEATVEVNARFDWAPDERVRQRGASLQTTIRSVEREATADPTIPLYFAGVTKALLACVEALPAAGHHFATSTQDPDEVAAATVAAAEAALEAVGQAMQAEGVREVLAAGTAEPVAVSPTLDATPADLLDYLEQDLTVASVDARAHEVETQLDEEAGQLASVAPARAVVEKAVGLVDDDQSTHAAAREFAALLLLDAVEQSLTRSAIRSRLDGSAE